MQSGPTLSIAHVHTAIIGTGGDRVSELEAQYLVQRGHRVTMVAPIASPIAARIRDFGIAICDDPSNRRTAERTARALGQLDIVHCHCMLSAPFAAELAKLSGAALVLHSHSMGEEWWECSSRRSKLQPGRRDRRKLIDAAIKEAHRVLCVSEPVVAHMRDLGLRTDHTMIVPNPVPDDFFNDQRDGPEQYDVCIIARASRPKRPFTMLRVLARAKKVHPELRAVWVGRLGHWNMPVKGAVALLGLRNVHFLGAVSPSDVRSVLDSSRVLFSASKREGQPLAVLEALVRGCDVVLSDIVAHRASFSAIEGASFFPEGDIETASRLIVAAANKHVRIPRTWLAERHGMQVHGNKLERAYREALSLRNQANPRQPVCPSKSDGLGCQSGELVAASSATPGQAQGKVREVQSEIDAPHSNKTFA